MSLSAPLAGERYHLFGIAGRGMAPLAIAARHLGADIDGCDRAGFLDSLESLERAGIPVTPEHDPAHVRADTTFVATSIAPETGPEVVAAAESARYWHRTDLLAHLFRARPGAGVTGSHGKGTVTAFAAAALAEAGLDPLAVIGAAVPALGGVTRVGDGPLVAEVDDSDLSLDRVATEIAVVTNLDDDHPHLATTLRQAVTAVGDFVASARRLVILGPSPRQNELAARSHAPVWRYGIEISARVQSREGGVTRLILSAPGAADIPATLQLLGGAIEVNAALGFATAIALGADPVRAAAGLGRLDVIRRRMERLGAPDGVAVFDDFGGKHPVNVRRGLETLRRHYPHARITAVFEPYGPYLPRWGRRYARALSLADRIVALPPAFLADYADAPPVAGDWHAACTAPVVIVHREAAVPTALSGNRAGDIVVFFAQIHRTRALALEAAGLPA